MDLVAKNSKFFQLTATRRSPCPAPEEPNSKLVRADSIIKCLDRHRLVQKRNQLFNYDWFKVKYIKFDWLKIYNMIG